ncbi:glycosyltransferase family 4 protein [Chitinasiproducens palmae]|uniref:Glycosyltransferase involved in cell wall bisynthesis n=1 Tax=Chitinasiproducens palmae TaxID=1770053 RepID=A0A1H2PPC0_9BURK|nr:glycosyltransferase family 4 protein [Chitinasiproducens palmae]SDV48601.1 Glycosyltransferase involved in cell wall bisynthesis [Chitinasiproducens palmae]
MRIALVSEAASGGVASHLAELIRGLADFPDVQVYLVLPEAGRLDLDILSPEVLALTSGTFYVPMVRAVGLHDAVHMLHLRRLLRRLKPDIVHSHSSKAGALTRVCRGPWKQLYTPHAIYTLRPDLSRKARAFYTAVERWLGAWFSDGIVAVSDEEAAHIVSSIKPGTTPVVTIYNGISQSRHLTRQAARQELGIVGNERIVGFVGRLEPQKGIDRLIAAAAEIDRRPELADVRILVIGPGSIEAYLPPGMAIPRCVTITGPVANAARLFAGLDLFVLPSRYEGFPYVYLEADAADVPIVSAPVAGAAAFVERGKRGFIVSYPDDPVVFADAISRGLREGKGQRSTRPQSDANRFTARRMCLDTLSLYRSLMGHAAGSPTRDAFHG